MDKIDESLLRMSGENARIIIKNTHQILRYKYRGVPLWVMVRDISGHGSGYSAEICRSANLDPEQMSGVAHLKDFKDPQASINFPDTNKPGEKEHNKMSNTATLDKIIARKNEQLEQQAAHNAGYIIDQITNLQTENINNNKRIEELRKQLKELEVRTVDRASILGE